MKKIITITTTTPITIIGGINRDRRVTALDEFLHFHEADADDSSFGVVTQAHAVGETGPECHHVLQRPANLHSGDVGHSSHVEMRVIKHLLLLLLLLLLVDEQISEDGLQELSVGFNVEANSFFTEGAANLPLKKKKQTVIKSFPLASMLYPIVVSQKAPLATSLARFAATMARCVSRSLLLLYRSVLLLYRSLLRPPLHTLFSKSVF